MILVAEAVGRLLLLSPADARDSAATGDGWQPLQIRRSASLLSHTGLVTGRRPLALATGRMLGNVPGGPSQLTAVLTEDWTVLAFDQQLQPAWEHSIGAAPKGRGAAAAAGSDLDGGGWLGASAHAAAAQEVSLCVSPTSIWAGDRGAIFVAGRASGRSHQPHHAGADGTGGSDVGPAPHFDYFALDGGGGAFRWEHRAADFHHGPHDGDGLSPQMDYKIDVAALGGQGGIDARHDGELPWRVFHDSVMGTLPHGWRHPADGSLAPSRFERRRRPTPAAQRERSVRTGQARASASVHLGLAGSGSIPEVSRKYPHLGLAGSLQPAASPPASPTSPSALGGDQGGSSGGGRGTPAAPNVLVAKRREGVEVLHLYTGRTLTQLVLPESSHSVAHAHADLNGDGSVDHVTAMTSRPAASVERAPDGGRHGRSKPKRAASTPCYGIATSGIPTKEMLWNTSVCSTTRRAEHSLTVAAPLLLPRERLGGGRPQRDSIFLASDGRLTSIGPEGALNWGVHTEAGWRVDQTTEVDLAVAAPLLPSLTLLAPTPSSLPLILALGEHKAVVVSSAGKVLCSVPLPQMPVAPPTLADFTGDGVLDVILQGHSAYYGDARDRSPRPPFPSPPLFFWAPASADRSPSPRALRPPRCTGDGRPAAADALLVLRLRCRLRRPHQIRRQIQLCP